MPLIISHQLALCCSKQIQCWNQSEQICFTSCWGVCVRNVIHWIKNGNEGRSWRIEAISPSFCLFFIIYSLYIFALNNYVLKQLRICIRPFVCSSTFNVSLEFFQPFSLLWISNIWKMVFCVWGRSNKDLIQVEIVIELCLPLSTW